MQLNDIHPNARLGSNVTVGNFSTICDDVVIGDNTIIEPNVVIYPGARIGKNCHIFPGSVISAVPQDLKFAGEYTTCEIGDNNVIRECCTINRDRHRQQQPAYGLRPRGTRLHSGQQLHPGQ